MDRIEFYDGESLIKTVDSIMVPPVGSKISIRNETWLVTSVTYGIDYVDKPFESSMRACVDLRRV